MDTAACRFCYFTTAAFRCAYKRDDWLAQKMPCLASNWNNAAVLFESMAAFAKSCTCGEPVISWEAKPRKGIPDEVDTL